MVLMVLPVFFIIMPANYFDVGQSICPSKLILNKECIGCGMTRATQHLIHFDFKTAWKFNKLTFVISPLLAFFYFRELIGQIKSVFK
jgi:hypothetical protein